MTIAERFSWAVIAGLLMTFVAAAAVAQHRLASRETYHPPRFVVAQWLPEAPAVHGPGADTFAGEYSESGVRRAVRDQFALLQALEKVKGYDVWSSASCPTWDMGRDWYLRTERRWSSLEIDAIAVKEFGDDRAVVIRHYRYRPNPDVDVNFEFPRPEPWTYANGAWHSELCAYGLGPDIRTMVETGIIQIDPGFIERVLIERAIEDFGASPGHRSSRER